MTARLILLTSCLLLPLTKSVAGEWEKLPPLPEPNGGFIGGTDGANVYVVGGTTWRGNTKHWLRSVWRLDLDKKEWVALDDLKKPAAYGMAGTRDSVHDQPKRFLFCGGSDGTATLNQVQTIGPAGVSLQPVEMPYNVVLSAGGIVRDKMVFSGGTTDAAKPSHFSSHAWALDFKSHEITRLPNYPAGPFGIAAAAIADGQLHVFGGAAWDAKAETVVNLDAAYAFSWSAKKWRPLKPLPFAVRGMAAIGVHNRIYLAGGYKNDAEGFTAEAFWYDDLKDEYRPAKPLPYKAMVGLVNCDGYVYCLGGEDKPKSRTDACYRIPVAELLK